ncbi:MAG: MFS transporter, partial [Pannonibacter indicus]
MQKTASGPWTPALVISLVAAGLILSLSMGLRQSLGLFMEPMVRTTGITAAAFGFAMAAQNLAWGIGQPFMGAICDRFGGRLVVALAAVLYCAGLYMTATGGPAGLYLGGGLLVGLAVAATSHGVLVGIISRLATPAIRATAVSILAAAGSLGTFIVAPAAQAMISQWNWQAALGGLALLAATMAGLALLFRRGANTEASDTGASDTGASSTGASGSAKAQCAPGHCRSSGQPQLRHHHGCLLCLRFPADLHCDPSAEFHRDLRAATVRECHGDRPDRDLQCHRHTCRRLSLP